MRPTMVRFRKALPKCPFCKSLQERLSEQTIHFFLKCHSRFARKMFNCNISILYYIIFNIINIIIIKYLKFNIKQHFSYAHGYQFRHRNHFRLTLFRAGSERSSFGGAFRPSHSELENYATQRQAVNGIIQTATRSQTFREVIYRSGQY